MTILTTDLAPESSEGTSGATSKNKLADIAALLNHVEVETGTETAVDTEAEASEAEASEAEASEAEASEEAEVTTEHEEETTVDTWGKALGVPDSQLVVSEDGELTGVVVKVDGVVSTVKIPDLIEGYQYAKSNTQKAQALAKERTEVTTLKQAVVTEYSNKLAVADKVLAHIQEALMDDFKAVNWEQLRHSDPAEYAALSQEYQQRKVGIDAVLTAVQTELQTEQVSKQQEVQVATQDYLKGQVERVLQNNPEWANPEKFKQALDTMQTFAGEAYGFTPQEFGQVQDARLIELIKDAMKYRKGLEQGKKKLAQAKPKFIKPGTTAASMSKVDKLVQVAKQNKGNKQAVSSAVAALLEL